jgi:hypothetical protein
MNSGQFGERHARGTPPIKVTGVRDPVRITFSAAAPSAIVGVTAPGPVAKIIRKSPGWAG